MMIFPQFSSGAVCQFPFGKTITYRTITNLLEGGSRIVLSDPNSGSVHWQLKFSGLTDTEAGNLQAFFVSAGGRLETFTFLDPSSNLLAWSEDFTQAVWQKSTFLQIQTAVSDPLGTTRASTVSNSGSGSLALVQTVNAPGTYLCCFSLYARSNNPVTITLNRGSVSQPATVSNDWQRVSLAATTSDGNDTSNFGIELPAGAQVDLFGLQVEAQPSASTYVQTLDQSGVYLATRFDSDSFELTSDAPNSNSCELTLYSRLTL